MASKIASRKAKGRRLQQLVATRIGELLRLPVGKDEMIASREMGQSGSDVRLIGLAKEQFPFAVECKNCESWSMHEWIKQAQSNAHNNNWLLVCKRNNQPPVVVMDMEVFFNLMEDLFEDIP